jgi:ABC-2 family transporter protein
LLGSIYILHRQLIELSHRRKLLAFLFILPLLLMVLFGALLSGQQVPYVPSGSTTPAIQALQNDKNLAALYAVYRADNAGASRTSPAKILVSSYQSPTNPSVEYLTYVLPGPTNTTVIVVNNATSTYQSAVVAPNGTIIKTSSGPLPAVSDIQTLPQVSMQPLYNDQTAMNLAQAAVEVFGLGLRIELGPQQRLIDVLFPEIVGLEIGWVGILGAAVTSVEDRISGARRRILMTPITRFSFVLGSALGNFLLIGLQLVVLFATGILVFHVNVAGSFYDLVPVVSAASFAVIGIGLVISHFSKTPDEAFYFSALINLPSGFLSSQYIQVVHTHLSDLISSLFPMTWANKGLTDIMVNGASMLSVLPDITILGIFAVVLYFAGTIMVIRER